MKPIPIFVGYDPREAIAYHTCVNSIIRNSSQPVAIVPVALNLFQDYAETHTDGSNHFIYTRFLVPYLCDFAGHAIFIDGDMIVRGDIAHTLNTVALVLLGALPVLRVVALAVSWARAGDRRYAAAAVMLVLLMAVGVFVVAVWR
jgi:hypothetical protein